MTLIPGFARDDELPVTGSPFLYGDEVAEAILRFKKFPDDRGVFETIKSMRFLDVDLVCLDAERASNGHVRLSYGVADYRQGDDALDEVLAPTLRVFGREIRNEVPDAIRLFRRAYDYEESIRGKWWSGSIFDAMREGIAQGEGAGIYSAMVPREKIIMRTRTTFGKGGTCPPEFVVDYTGLDIRPIS